MSSTKTVNKLRVVLIVEDDTELRRMWRIALSVEGFEVEEAGDGIEALQHLEQRSPDLIVLDLGLPRLSGFSVRQEIAAHAVTRKIPIIVATGSTMDLGHLNVSCVLRKPVTPEELVAAVESCLHFRASSASS